MCPSIHSYCLTLVGLAGVLQVLSVTSALGLTIAPDHVAVGVDPSNVTVTCTTDVPLIGCQFTWFDLITQGGQQSARPVLELSHAPQFHSNSSHLDWGLTGYTYSGRGLGAGDCGVTLELKGSKEWMVGCRVRTERGGWRYAWVQLYAWVRNTLPVTVSPQEVVVLPGGEFTLVCRTPEPLATCKFYLPGSESNIFVFDEGSQAPDSAGRFVYSGEGLEKGECGITVKNVTEFDNEPVTCYTFGFKVNQMRVVPVIVASAPRPPVLQVAYEGSTLEATCVVGPSRPVATITWLLDDDVIRQDAEDDSTADSEEAWRWPWLEASIRQNLTHSLTPQDNGKLLRCVTSHQALLRSQETTTQISF